MEINKELTQLIEALLNENNTDFILEFGYIKLQEDDLKDVARELELTPKQIKDLEEYGSNFLMIQSPEGFLCEASSWESWVHDEKTDFIPGLHSIWNGGVEKARENKPFQICIDNKWVGTLPYSKQLVEKLNPEEKRLNSIIESISGRVMGEVSKALNACSKKKI
jgi:hypothetical protein